VRAGTVCKGGVRARTVCKERRGTLWIRVRALWVRKCTKKAKRVYKRAHRGLVRLGMVCKGGVRLGTVRKRRIRPVYNNKLTSQTRDEFKAKSKLAPELAEGRPALDFSGAGLKLVYLY
jgi:hypothetical protein